jgi:hypothetical protein
MLLHFRPILLQVRNNCWGLLLAVPIVLVTAAALPLIIICCATEPLRNESKGKKLPLPTSYQTGILFCTIMIGSNYCGLAAAVLLVGSLDDASDG